MARTKQTARIETKSRSAIAKSSTDDAKARPAKSAKVPRATIAKADAPKAERKPHRFRPGTVALRDIKRQQKSEVLALRKAPFRRLAREIANDYGIIDDGVRFTKESLEVLQWAAEDFAIEMLNSSLGNQIHAKRQTLKLSDMKRAEKLYNTYTAGTGSIVFKGVDEFEDPGRARMAFLIAELKAKRDIRSMGVKKRAPKKAAPKRRSNKPAEAEPVEAKKADEPAQEVAADAAESADKKPASDDAKPEAEPEKKADEAADDEF